MNAPKRFSCLFIAALLLAAWRACAQDDPHPVLVTNPPPTGTFFLLQADNPAPYPFDPFFGELPVYFWDGVYFVDDTTVDYVSLRSWQNSMLESAPSPGDDGGPGGGGETPTMFATA